ncbi:MAG TPA: hypothetical protein VFT13_13820 [Candidatus Krumholzibacteria bacterium]|nr:hypothetical protein [Candidatus Krumholzibacteria bacterium]
MNLYPFLIFLHVVGGVGIFMALGIEVVALGRLRRAETSADARAWMGLMKVSARMGPVSMLTNLATGVWMMVRWWGPQPWLHAAMIAVVAIALIGGIVTRRGMRRLRGALAAESGPDLSGAFGGLRSHHALAASLRVRAALAVGILALMTMKPGIAGSFLALAAAIVAGLLATIPLGVSRTAATEANRAGGVS